MDYKYFHFLRNLTALLCGTFLIFSIYPFMQYQKTSDWPFVTGIITKSEMRDGGAIFLGIGSIYHADIEFEYTVGDKVLTGNRIQYGIGGKSFLFERFAQGMVDRYPVGKSTAVYYNPENPEDEIVELAPVLGFGVLWILLTVFFFGMAVFMTFKRDSMLSDGIDRNRSLRPEEWEDESLFKDFYPTLIYNPPERADAPDQAAHSPRQRVRRDQERQPTPFDGDYPSQVYQPPGPGQQVADRQTKKIVIPIPVVGWRVQLTFALLPPEQD